MYNQTTYTTEQKLLILLCHLGVFLGVGVLAPIIIFFVSQDSIVKHHAKEAFGFQGLLYIAGMVTAILFTIGGVLSVVLIGIPIILLGVILVIALVIMGLIFPVIAAIRSLKGEAYCYPISSPIVQRML
ncbi:MAG: DUF4870 domain-containing protein [Epulopiscium sp.]|nr:DUF4870 domain-containing protein [Candidatus Epulonipiscium sp.]